MRDCLFLLSAIMACLTAPIVTAAEKSSVTEADFVRSPFARFARAIEDGDAETAADFVAFPFERPAPLPPIRTREEFVAYFPTLFDDGFRRALRNSSFEKDWHDFGWRGVYVTGIAGAPDFWLTGSLEEGGKLYAIEFPPCLTEYALWQKAVKSDVATLPSSLRKARIKPEACILSLDGKTAARIDWLPDCRIGDGEKGDELYRIALFTMPLRAGDKPKTVFFATSRPDGNGGGSTYCDCSWFYSLGDSYLETEVESDDAPPRWTLRKWPFACPETGETDAVTQFRSAVWAELLAGRTYPWVARARQRDALRQSRYAAMHDCKKETACFYALWRHPIAEDAVGNPIRDPSPESSDIPHPIPTLNAEHLEFLLTAEIGKPLVAIYGERATFEIAGGSDSERRDEKMVMERIRTRRGGLPLLTIREVANYAIENTIVEERVDFSFSRNGEWLIVERGYLIPDGETSDGKTPARSRDRTIFAIPDSRQREVCEHLEKAEVQPADWAESFKASDGSEALGFLVVTHMDLGVDDDDHRPGADDLRSQVAQTGVKAGDILLSFCGNVRGVDFSKRTLRASCGEYSKMWGSSEGDCYFARMREGKPEVFSCDSGELFQCEVAIGTAFLRVAPRRFDRAQMDCLGKALSDYLKSHPTAADDP